MMNNLRAANSQVRKTLPSTLQGYSAMSEHISGCYIWEEGYC